MARGMGGALCLGLALVGCGDKEGDSASAFGEEVEGGGSGSEECGGTAPVITEVVCENIGLQEYETGTYPQLLMRMQVTDADKDIHQYSAEVYFDETEDGSVLLDSSPFDPVSGSTSEASCNTDDASINFGLVITGGNPSFDTVYEWALVVKDAQGLASDPYVLTCATPKEDGSDGG